MKNDAFGLLKKEWRYNIYAAGLLALLGAGQMLATHYQAVSLYFVAEIVRALGLAGYVLYLSYVFAVKKQWIALSARSVLSLGFRAVSLISLAGIVVVLLLLWRMPELWQKALSQNQSYWRNTLSLSEPEIAEYSAQFPKQYFIFQLMQVLLFNMLVGIPTLLIGALFMVKRKQK